MSKTITALDFVGKLVFRSTLVIASSYLGSSLARADLIAMQAMDFPERHHEIQIAEPEPEVKPSPALPEQNSVEPLKVEKLEYEPVTDEKPLLESRKSKVEHSNGSVYEEGEELYITPEAGFVIKDDQIEEKPAPPGEIDTPGAASVSL